MLTAPSVFPEIYKLIANNPHKHATLRLRPVTQTQGSESQETWDRFRLKPIQPPGALSLLLWHTDSMYALGTSALRKQILTEQLLELQLRAEREIVGRRYPRKKIQDLLANELTADEGAHSVSNILEEVLCELFLIQKVQLNRKKKSIAFFPPDLRNWSSERPILFADDENCWSFEHEGSFAFLSWLTQKEEEGWTLRWPTAEGKLEELKVEATKRGLTIHAAPGSDSQKVKKEDYARVIGRAEALTILGKLNLVVQ